MRVLLTGAFGFLGQEIIKTLHASNHEVDTLSRNQKATYSVDIAIEKPILTHSYDLIIHAAGKAHSVPKLEHEKEEFYDTNVLGTKHLLNALEQTHHLPKAFVFISSVAVYGLEEGENIDENYPLLGTTPYATSKIQAEKLISIWADAHQIPLLIFRLPLLAGTNPPGNLGSMKRAIKKGWYIKIGKSEQKKSILCAQDVALAILDNYQKKGIYNLTDGRSPAVYEIENALAKAMHKPIRLRLPFGVVLFLAKIGDCFGNKFPLTTLRLKKLTSTLTFSSEKAKAELLWKPKNTIEYLSNE
ncbi:MAG: NAD-dependent epimerase/dehydratase family protein [Chitinophagaceae bacterium]